MVISPALVHLAATVNLGYGRIMLSLKLTQRICIELRIS